MAYGCLFRWPQTLLYDLLFQSISSISTFKWKYYPACCCLFMWKPTIKVINIAKFMQMIFKNCFAYSGYACSYNIYFSHAIAWLDHYQYILGYLTEKYPAQKIINSFWCVSSFVESLESLQQHTFFLFFVEFCVSLLELIKKI